VTTSAGCPLDTFGPSSCKSAKTWCAKPAIVVSFNVAKASAEILGALAPRRGVIDMADDSGPFRSYGRHDREHIRRQYQERLKAYHGWVHGGASAGPWLANRLNEHVNDAIAFVSQVRQARNLQDVLRLRTAFVQKKIDMLAGSARALTDVLANARPAVRSVKTVSEYRSHVEAMARNSPRYEAPERVDDQVRFWRARPRDADDR
jgi:hypothetical protein